MSPKWHTPSYLNCILSYKRHIGSQRQTPTIRHIVTIRYTYFCDDEECLNYIKDTLNNDDQQIDDYFTYECCSRWMHLCKHKSCGGHVCACKQKNLEDLTYICCEDNGNILLIGSECIKHFCSKEGGG